MWTQEGQYWQKGTWLTGSLWVIALAAHLGYDYVIAPGHGGKSVGDATALLYVAASFLIQRLIVQCRVRKAGRGRPVGGADQPGELTSPAS